MPDRVPGRLVAASRDQDRASLLSLLTARRRAPNRGRAEYDKHRALRGACRPPAVDQHPERKSPHLSGRAQAGRVRVRGEQREFPSACACLLCSLVMIPGAPLALGRAVGCRPVERHGLEPPSGAQQPAPGVRGCLTHQGLMLRENRESRHSARAARPHQEDCGQAHRDATPNRRLRYEPVRRLSIHPVHCSASEPRPCRWTGRRPRRRRPGGRRRGHPFHGSEARHQWSPPTA